MSFKSNSLKIKVIHKTYEINWTLQQGMIYWPTKEIENILEIGTEHKPNPKEISQHKQSYMDHVIYIWFI
jgi:hypothetical protein